MRNTTFPGPLDTLILYPELSAAQVRRVQRLLGEGKLYSLARGIVSTLPAEEWPSLVARNRLRIIKAFIPEAVMYGRSAFYGGTAHNNTLTLMSSRNRVLHLPGLTIRSKKGVGPLPGDQLMQASVYFPSETRCLLENLTFDTKTTWTVGPAEVEKRLLSICENRGETALIEMRETARTLAPQLGLLEELPHLENLIGGVLHTRTNVLITPQGVAHEKYWDHERIALFQTLATHLSTQTFSPSLNVCGTLAAERNFALLESYFSNFIEGTEFTLDEAKTIAFENKAMDSRPKDSHDILGVYQQIQDPGWRVAVLPSGEPILEQLRIRHRVQMARRPEVHPGEFKTEANRAGNTYFVEPGKVHGTLIEGSKLLPSVPPGMARSIFAHFLLSEIHPFTDGNGRLARLLMNAELSLMNLSRIIVPTLYREEYLDCLRVLSRDGEPEPFVKAITKIQAWTAGFSYDDLDNVVAQMTACNAFQRSLVQYKLKMPWELPSVFSSSMSP